MQPGDLIGLVIAGGFFAFWDAFGIGANDVANSFANSVASRTITLKQACIIAIFTEFGGAVLMGAETTSAIKNSIIDTKLWSKIPEQLMFGFVCALIASSFWVIAATRLGFPVSTTHSIVGAIAGIGISKFGFSAINASEFWKIILSWVVSPGVAGVLASIFYLITKYTVMKAENSLQRGLRFIPLFFMFTIAICTFFVINKAPKGIDLSKAANSTPENWRTVLLISILGGGLFVGLYVWLFIVPYFQRMLVEEEDLRWYHMFYIRCVPKQGKNPNLEAWLEGQTDKVKKEVVATPGDVDATEAGYANVDDDKPQEKKKNLMSMLTHGVNVDVVTVEGEQLENMHAKAVKHDPKTEYLFSYLQVATAAFASFAHGSNDVANAAGPFSAILAIYDTAKIPAKNVEVPFLLLAGMGIAIDLGLVLYGYNIMKVLGNHITYQSPSRGFNMELGASFTVIVASFLGLPVSTTHCITGATVAVGLCNGEFWSINWRMVLWIIFSWVITLPITAGISGLLFAFKYGF
jgi:sodium-dependent phosphate transporter